MGKHEKLLLKIISGTSDANIQFEDLCSLLKHLCFDMRVKGSHHMFRKESLIFSVRAIRQSLIRLNR